MTGRKKLVWVIAGLSLLCLVLLVLDLCTGEMRVDLFHPDPLGRQVLSRIRIPRALTALLAGAGLSVAGAQMQGILRNPLADPHIMGVSGGAGLGAALTVLVLPAGGAVSLAAGAFAGAALTSVLIVIMARRSEGFGTLLIFGVMLGFILSAITSLLEYSASEHSLKVLYSWSAGSFSASGRDGIVLMASAVALGLGIAGANHGGLDAILFGDDYVRCIGGNVSRIRTLALVSCCLITGTITAFCGPIGFVGIVGPHIARWVLGSSRHAVVLPGAALCGSVIALTADVLSQLFPSPLPVGSTVAVIGIPVILFVLLKKK